MRKNSKLTIENAKVGLKVKIRIPRCWSEVPIRKPYSKGPCTWVKGKIKEASGKSIIVNTKYKYGSCCQRNFTENMFCC